MILSIGCSHSLGPYDKNDKPINEIIDHTDLYYEPKQDWPSALYSKTNGKYKHIAMPGLGAVSYYEALKFLDDNDYLSGIDKLIVQWTNEPRLATSNNPTQMRERLEHALHGLFSTDDDFVMASSGRMPIYNITGPASLTTHVINGSLTDSKPDTKTSLFVAELISNLQTLYTHSHNAKSVFELSKTGIKDLCAKNDIQYYEFAWARSSSIGSGLSKQQGFKSVNFIADNGEYDIVKTELQKQKELHNITERLENDGGHLMPRGQDLANKIIIDFMTKQGLFE